MDIGKILEAKKREIEAKLQVRQQGEVCKQPPHSSLNSLQPSSSSASLYHAKDEEIRPGKVEIMNNVACDGLSEASSAQHQYRRECASAQPYQEYRSVLHAKPEEHLLPEERLHQGPQIELSSINTCTKKRSTDASSSQPSQSGALDGPDRKKRSSRWGPQPEAGAAGPSGTFALNEEQASALQLMHLRQELAARDMALTAKAGVAEMKLGLPSSEHRMRALEMDKTKEQAQKLTKSLSEGKHHMQDFLPKEELLKFLKTPNSSLPAPPTAQYEDNKLTDTNVGYQMLKKFGWSEGKGLGTAGTGISAPINSVAPIERAGLGTKKPDEPTEDDDEFTLYRKRMMTAYKYRPNPLNNPRRPYY